jgi:hypothetical protein
MFADNALSDAARSVGVDAHFSFGFAYQAAPAWIELCARGACVSSKGRFMNRPLAELPNYFEPLATIEALGYSPLEYFAGDAVFLVSPR